DLWAKSLGYEEVEDVRPTEALRFGDVACLPHEVSKGLIGDCVWIDVKGVNPHLSHGPLAVFGEAFLVVCSHEERPALDVTHPVVVFRRVRADRGLLVGLVLGRWTLRATAGF